MATETLQPHYRQIERTLRARISRLRPGERVPSDSELCLEFGVSRMTARNAMQRLADDGLIRREPGRGSFVALPPAHRRANRLMTFTQEMARAGRVPSSRMLTRVVRPSSASEASSLGIPARAPVVHLVRLRLADDQPIALESSVLLAATADAVMTADLSRGSLHETLRRAGFMLRRGTGTISAVPATARDAELLSLHKGDALLVERRIIVDGHGRRIEATESRYSGERYGLDVQFDVEAPPDDASLADDGEPAAVASRSAPTAGAMPSRADGEGLVAATRGSSAAGG